MDCKSVGERVKARKRALKFTVEDLSNKSGVPEDTINNIIYGRITDPRIETIARIAVALNISLDHIVFGTAPAEGTPPEDPKRIADIDQHVQTLKEHHAREVASLIEAHDRHVRDMKEAHEREVAAVREHFSEIRHTQTFWRSLSCGLGALTLLVLLWFTFKH